MSRVPLPLRAAVIGALAAVALSAAAPAAGDTLSIQGALRSAGGGPVADGSYGVGFTFYADPAGKTKVFEELFIGVEVKGGTFALELGAAGTPFDGKAIAAKASWLGVKVGSEPQLPLVAVSAVLRAYRADVAESALAADTAKLADFATTANTAKQADQATSATSADSAKKADFATSAAHAASADNAKKADAAKQADQATTASFAEEAGTAKAADVAKSAQGLKCTGCVDNAALANGAVTTDKIQDGTIKAEDLADGAITLAKLGAACKEGEFLRKTAAGWACIDLTPLMTPPKKATAKVWTRDGATDICHEAAQQAWADVPDLKVDFSLDGDYVVLTEFDLNVVAGGAGWVAFQTTLDGKGEGAGTHVEPSHGGEDDHVHLFRIDKLGAGAHSVALQWGLGAGQVCNPAAQYVWMRRVSVVAFPADSGVQYGYKVATTTACRDAGAWATVPDLKLDYALAADSVVLSEADLNWVGPSNAWMALRMATDGKIDPEWTHTQPEGGSDEDDHVHLHRLDDLAAGNHSVEAQWGDGSGKMCNPAGSGPHWSRRIGWLALPKAWGAQMRYVSGKGTAQRSAGAGYVALPGLAVDAFVNEPRFFAALAQVDFTYVGGDGAWVALRGTFDGKGDKATHSQPIGGPDEEDHLHTHRVDVFGPGFHTWTGDWGEGGGSVTNYGANHHTRRLGVLIFPISAL